MVRRRRETSTICKTRCLHLKDRERGVEKEEKNCFSNRWLTPTGNPLQPLNTHTQTHRERGRHTDTHLYTHREREREGERERERERERDRKSTRLNSSH